VSNYYIFSMLECTAIPEGQPPVQYNPNVQSSLPFSRTDLNL